MLNAAIIGLGWWGRRLVQSAKGSSAIRIARGVTLEPELAKDFATEMNISLGTSYEDALADAKIDAVLLATPHTRHRVQVEAAAAAGKHVFCEKPFALSHADAEAALAACMRAGVALGVGQHFRLMPSMRALHDVVASGEIGTVMHVEGNYSHDWLAAKPLDDWRSAPEETRAGGMTSMGIHVLDSFGHVLGPMRRISALSTKRVLPLAAGDSTAALVEFMSGATGTLATTLKTPFVWRICVFGSDAWAASVSETRFVLCRCGQEPEVRDFEPNNHLVQNLESFADAALGRGAFHIDAAGILHTVGALEAVFRSVDADGAWQMVA
jgi:predicted dehydrogenase